MLPRPPTSPLFPYTTLFRSPCVSGEGRLRLRRESLLSAASFAHELREEIPRQRDDVLGPLAERRKVDRKSTRLNSSHQIISYAVFCLKKKKKNRTTVHFAHD